MQLNEVEKRLRDMLASEEAEAGPARRFAWPFRRGIRVAKTNGATRDRRSDFVVACLGVTLGLICALFPWYIFFNQDQFGVRAIKFGAEKEARSGVVTVVPQDARVGAPLTADDIPSMAVDMFPTGTLQDEKDDAEKATPDLGEQPFPSEPAIYKLVHVANGRAMIEDETGLWMVQRGSPLPDNSSVAAIEQRQGKWVLVTSADKVIELTR
jgi:hypothetical protein